MHICAADTIANSAVLDTCGLRHDTACMICFENEADHVLLPCGHGGYCGTCSHTLLCSGPPTVRVCPMCRTPLFAAVCVPVDTPIGAIGGVATVSMPDFSCQGGCDAEADAAVDTSGGLPETGRTHPSLEGAAGGATDEAAPSQHLHVILDLAEMSASSTTSHSADTPAPISPSQGAPVATTADTVTDAAAAADADADAHDAAQVPTQSAIHAAVELETECSSCSSPPKGSPTWQSDSVPCCAAMRGEAATREDLAIDWNV